MKKNQKKTKIKLNKIERNKKNKFQRELEHAKFINDQQLNFIYFSKAI